MIEAMNRPLSDQEENNLYHNIEVDPALINLAAQQSAEWSQFDVLNNFNYDLDDPERDKENLQVFKALGKASLSSEDFTVEAFEKELALLREREHIAAEMKAKEESDFFVLGLGLREDEKKSAAKAKKSSVRITMNTNRTPLSKGTRLAKQKDSVRITAADSVRITAKDDSVRITA